MPMNNRTDFDIVQMMKPPRPRYPRPVRVAIWIAAGTGSWVILIAFLRFIFSLVGLA